MLFQNNVQSRKRLKKGYDREEGVGQKLDHDKAPGSL